MTTTTSPVGTAPSGVPRKVLISAWAVPVLVLGQFSFLAALPVGIIVVGVLRHVPTGSLRRRAIALGAAFAAPMLIWGLRPDRAPSLSKDMSPVFVLLIVATAAGVIAAIHRDAQLT